SSNSGPAPAVASCSGDGFASPSVRDGGASAAAVPHEDGVGPMSKSSTAPSRRSDAGVDVLLFGLPLLRSDCTWTFPDELAGALMTTSRPSSRWLVARLTSGEPTAQFAEPICSG